MTGQVLRRGSYYGCGTAPKGLRCWQEAPRFKDVANIQTPPPPVLLVEDEWLLRLELAIALEETGFRVLEADSGERALALLGEISSLALLVTDIRLGGAVSGWDVADACRARDAALPVVYVSANVPDAARQLTPSKFFTKPIRLTELLLVCTALVAP